MLFNPTQYHRALVAGLHDRWVSTHRELREVTNPTWRESLIDDLQEIHQQAKALLEHDDNLHPIDSSTLHHIISRPVKDHLTILSIKQ